MGLVFYALSLRFLERDEEEIDLGVKQILNEDVVVVSLYNFY